MKLQSHRQFIHRMKGKAKSFVIFEVDSLDLSLESIKISITFDNTHHHYNTNDVKFQTASSLNDLVIKLQNMIPTGTINVFMGVHRYANQVPCTSRITNLHRKLSNVDVLLEMIACVYFVKTHTCQLCYMYRKC